MTGRLGAILLNIQQLSCVLIGCIFYGLVQRNISLIKVAGELTCIPFDGKL